MSLYLDKSGAPIEREVVHAVPFVPEGQTEQVRQQRVGDAHGATLERLRHAGMLQPRLMMPRAPIDPKAPSAGVHVSADEG